MVTTSTTLSYWTPVKYGNQATCLGDKLVEGVDSYFHLKGRVAVVVPDAIKKNESTGLISRGVQLEEGSTNWWTTALKVVSYATVILPVLMLLAKWILRGSLGYQFHINTISSRVLPNGVEERGAIVNGVLESGMRLEKDKPPVYVSPKLLLGEVQLPEKEIELNFAEVEIDGRPEIIPVQQLRPNKIFDPCKEYVRYPGSAMDALLKMAQDTKVRSFFSGDRHYGPPVKYVLEHAHNHLMDPKEFLTFLLTPNEQGEMPIHTVNEKSLIEILELENEIAGILRLIDVKIIETLFTKWAGQGKVKLVTALLDHWPAAIRQTIGREPSFYSQAVLDGHSGEAEILYKAMVKEGIELTPTDQWIHKAFTNDCNFTNEELLWVQPELRWKLYQVANTYVKKEFLAKLRVFGMRPPQIAPRRAALFSHTMDAIDVEQTLKGFLRNLHDKGLLLTKQEFAQKDLTQYYHKGNDVARILGRDYIEKTAERMNLPYVKVPRKTAVIKPEKAESPSIAFTVEFPGSMQTDDLQIYAERITPIDRKATRKEMLGLLDLVEEIGFNDFLGDNLMMGKNWDGEEGIYCIDTEYSNFSSLPYHNRMGSLDRLMAPEDHQWLFEEIDRRQALFKPQRAEKVAALQAEHEERRPVAIQHGFGNKRTFTVPIADIIPQDEPVPQAAMNG